MKITELCPNALFGPNTVVLPPGDYVLSLAGANEVTGLIEDAAVVVPLQRIVQRLRTFRLGSQTKLLYS